MFWHQCCDRHSEGALFIECQALTGPLLHSGSRDVQSSRLEALALEGVVPAEGEWVDVHGSNCVSQVLGAGPGLPSRLGEEGRWHRADLGLRGRASPRQAEGPHLGGLPGGGGSSVRARGRG